MQLKTVYQDVQTSGIEQSQTMKISDDPVIWRFLTDQLYTQKNAWIREYAQNARDVDPNWRIVLPSLHSTECQFIDNGPGMSKEFMLNQFCQAGFSTKRNSDNQSGGFGIGRLSGPQGTIIECRNEDMIRTWALVKNKNSIPSVSLLTEVPRPDDVLIGTTVRVPVKPNEIQSIKNDVHKFLMFYKLPGLPEIKYIIERPEWAIVDAPTDWSKGENPPLVEVGGYTFSAKWDQFASAANHIPHADRALMQQVYRAQHGPYVLVHVPIGSVNIALNRESIKFDEDTVSTLHRVALVIRDEIAATTQKELNACKTMWEARIKYGELAGSNLGGLWDQVSKKLTWNGKIIDSQHYSIEGNSWRVTCENYRHRSSRSRAVGDDLPQNVRPTPLTSDYRSGTRILTPSKDNITFLAVDTDDAVSRRLRAQFTRKDEVWFIWEPKAPLLKDGTVDTKWVKPANWWQPFLDFIDGEGSVGFKFMKLSDIVPLPVAPRAKPAPGAVKSTIVRNKFYRMVDCYTSFEPFDVDLSDKKTQFLWVPFHRDDLEPGEKTATVTHEAWWKQGKITPNPDWKNGSPQMHLIRNVLSNHTIIGVPRSQRNNVPDHWTHVCDYLINTLPDRKEWPEILMRSGEHGKFGGADQSLMNWTQSISTKVEKYNPNHPLVKLYKEAKDDLKLTQDAGAKLPHLRLFDIGLTNLMKKDVTLRDFEKDFKTLIDSSPALSILAKVASSTLSNDEVKFLVDNA